MDVTQVVDAVLDDLVRSPSPSRMSGFPRRSRSAAASMPPSGRCSGWSVPSAVTGRSMTGVAPSATCGRRLPDRVPVWLEFKRCWSASGWVNKPPEQIGYWQADLDKLRKVPVRSERYFLLVGFFDFDPLDEVKSNHSG